MPKKRPGATEMPPELMQMLEQLFSGGAAPAPLSAEGIADELSALPRRPEDWLVVTRGVTIEGEFLLLSLVVCPDIPVPLVFQPMETADELLRFVIESMGLGQGESEDRWEPYVPARLRVNDPQLAFGWGNLLRDAGVKVELGVPPELERMVMDAAQQFELVMGGAGQAVPFLSDKTPQEAGAFLEAFDGFMKVRPWEWLDPRPVFVRWQDESGQSRSLYAVVMGHDRQVFGLSLFERWTDYIEVLLAGNGPESMAAVIAQGGREAVTLAQSGDELADEDWHFLQQHRLTRKKRENWSGGVQQRIGLDGALLPHFPLALLTELLNLLAEHAPVSRRDFLTSFKRRGQKVQVSFPGTARDELSAAEASQWVRLRAKVHDHRVEFPQQKLIELEVVAPGDTLLARVFNGKQFQQLWQSKLDVASWSQSRRSTLNYDLPDRIYRLVDLGDEQTQLYVYSRNETNPTLAQLLELSRQEPLYITGLYDRAQEKYETIPLQIEQADGPLTDAEVELNGVGMRWLE